MKIDKCSKCGTQKETRVIDVVDGGKEGGIPIEEIFCPKCEEEQEMKGDKQ